MTLILLLLACWIINVIGFDSADRLATWILGLAVGGFLLFGLWRCILIYHPLGWAVLWVVVSVVVCGVLKLVARVMPSARSIHRVLVGTINLFSAFSIRRVLVSTINLFREDKIKV